MWHLFFPQDSSIYLVHRIVGFDFAVILVYPFIFCMRHNLIPAPEKELVASASVFQDCHLIRSPSMSEAFRCQMGKNTCKPCQSLDMQLTAATQKKSTTESQTWLLLLPSAAPGKMGYFGQGICFLTAEQESKRKTSGCHHRSKGCFGGQCFGSSTSDPKPDLFCLSKLKYKDTKASQIKSHRTFFQHSHSNTFHQSFRAPRRCRLGGCPVPIHSSAISKATSSQSQLYLSQPQKPSKPLWVAFPMQYASPFDLGPTQAPQGAVCEHCPLIYWGGIWVLQSL